MSTLTEFLETDLAKGAIIKGTIDGLIAQKLGRGLEAEAEYRASCQAEARRHRKNGNLYDYAATQQAIAFLRALTS